MKILPLLLTGALLAACEPIMPFSDTRDAEPEFGEVDPVQTAPALSIIDTAPVGGTDWLLARVGLAGERRDDAGSSSSYSGRTVANIVILDKRTGASVSLLPNERNIVRGHRIIWPVAGVVDGSAPGAAQGGGEALAPTHFMLDADLRDNRGRVNPASRRLLIGTLSDFTSSLVARGYTQIHHMEMLDDSRLSILLGYPDRDELLVVNLPEQTIQVRKLIDPARVSR